MFFKYPGSVEAHVRELRRDFDTALVSTKGVRVKDHLPELISGAVRCGVRKGVGECLSRGTIPSREARKVVEEMIVSQISSELYRQTQNSALHDGVPRTVLKSLNASFMALSHKYTMQAANSAAKVQFPAGSERTAPASPAETLLEIDDDSGSPPDWQHEKDDPIPNKDNKDAANFKIVVSLADRKAITGMNDGDLTRLVNQSIGSDPEIPSHLSDSEWVTSANSLWDGDIEIHVETEDDREFLTLNTHWRPKLEQNIAAWHEMHSSAMDIVPYRKTSSELGAREASAITRIWKRHMTETMGHSSVNVSSSQRDKACQPNDRCPTGEDHRHVGRTFPCLNQRNGNHTAELEQPYLPRQGTEDFELADCTLKPELAAPTIGQQPVSTGPNIGHKRRGAFVSDTLSRSDDTTKRPRLAVDEQ